MSSTASVRTEQVINFLANGYLFASQLRSKAGVSPDSAQPVKTRLLGRTAVLVRGEEGVKLFYDTDRVKRDGAMPGFISTPLFGSGAVHSLDGEEHAVRKKALTDMAYDDVRVADFKTLVAEEIETMVRGWAEQPGNVYDDAALAYGRAAFRWAGLPISTEEMNKQAKRMSRLLDTFGRPQTNPVALVERRRLDKWAKGLIEQVRNGEIQADPASVLSHMADLRDPTGELVDAHTAGVELQNLTRPTVAVSRFAAFAATALLEHPQWTERINQAAAGQLNDVPEAVAFAQEVRRTYPFVPMLPAVATTNTEISGCPVKKGQRVLIDILGTNTAPTEWEAPESFDPERFLDIEDAEKLTSFIPQGGGEVLSGHRCPGEKIAVTALAAAVTALARPEIKISGEIEDRVFSWTQMLTRPSTGVRVSV